MTEKNERNLLNKRIGVMMGGFGNEREISLQSGEFIYNTLIEHDYNAIRIDPANHFIETLKEQKIDVIFNILHGPFGEDGTVQAILNFLQIPYTSEGVLPSGLAFDKLKTKEILKAYNLPTAPYYHFYELAPGQVDFDGLISDLFEAGFEFPFFFKKSCSGSSRGVWLIKNKENFEQTIEISDFTNSPAEYFVEKRIEGREVTVGIWKNQNKLEIFPIAEVKMKSDFFTFDVKYSDGKSETIIPAPLTSNVEEKIKSIVKKIYKIFRFQGCVRIDFMLDENLNPFVLEINNQPGMTSHSMIPLINDKEIKNIDDRIYKISTGRSDPKKIKTAPKLIFIINTNSTFF